MVTPALVAVLTKLHATSRWMAGDFARTHGLQFVGDPLGKGRGVGRPLGAQRYNVQGGARVFYLGDTPATCYAETQFLLGNAPATGFATVPVKVSLTSVLDLTQPAILQALGLTTQVLIQNFRTLANPVPTQDIGEACEQHKLFDGIFYESVAALSAALAAPPMRGAPTPAKMYCLAVLERNLVAGKSYVEAPDPDPSKPAHRLP